MSATSTEAQEDRILEYLRESLPDFEVCSRRAVECILGLPTYCARGFRILPSLANPVPVTCVIQSENGRYGTTLSLGVHKADYAELLPSKMDDEEVADVIGEISNVVAGNFLGRPAFARRFGEMLPSPPQFTPSGASLRRSWCIHGVLAVNSVKIYLGFIAHYAQKDYSE